ncbi:hypothetical protein B7P43_G00439 [Cryptotermes secundus]|uniref:Centriolar and ciliogenesis-associated protein HYLS1 C-terminal domain-containing protein n=1 Tax=Cryptotermes secundus TaxID=105785 RepID=A0A2J7R8L5_9NEOP|nr:hypothetical protein B7P43_G00439 [Cryptotermes secundus]
MTIKLDPKEVKAHLHRLGYCNITGEQLREFIKDLKKLIKYDQHLLCTCKDSAEFSESSYKETSLETLRTSNSTSSPSGNENSHIEKYGRDQSRDTTAQKCVTCTRSFAHNVQSGDGSSRACVSGSAALPNTAGITKKSAHFSKQEEAQKLKSVENLQESVKAKHSFIRPRNIQPGQQAGAPKRCDPVKLYHHYQDIWRQQKVPGEDNHSNLRWCIRVRMLGEDPQPRVSITI